MNPTRQGITLETIRKVALALPEVEERSSYGTPGFFVRKKLFARWHQDGDKLVVRVTDIAREAWFRIDPDTYFITDHYRGYPYMLVRHANLTMPALRKVLAEAWEQAAPARLRESKEI